MLRPHPLSRRSALTRLGTGGLAAALAVPDLRQVTAQDATPATCLPFLPDIVLDWFGAWEADDPPRAVAALYTPDGGYYDVPSLTSAHGPAEIETYLRTRLAGLELPTRHMRGSFGAGNRAAVEQLFTATNQGVFPQAPTGLPFQVYLVTIIEIENDRVAATSDYYDIATILRELGASTLS